MRTTQVFLALLALLAVAYGYWERPYTGAPYPCAVHDTDGVDVAFYDELAILFTICTRECTSPGYPTDCPSANNPVETIGATPLCSGYAMGKFWCVLLCDLWDPSSTCPTNNECRSIDGDWGVCAWPWPEIHDH